MHRFSFQLARSSRLFANLHGGKWRHSVVGFALLFALMGTVFAQEATDWESSLKQQTATHNWPAALQIIDQRLQSSPADVDAQAWRARILAWSGHWSESEHQYRQTLAQAPKDIDLLTGLSDVLFWEGKLGEASSTLGQAEQLSHSDEVSSRRAKIDEALRERAAEAAQQQTPTPATAVASFARSDSSELPKYSLSFGTETDLFSFTTPVQAQSAAFGVRWNSRWTSTFSGESYRRLGEAAEEFASTISLRTAHQGALTLSAGQGTHQDIAPIHRVGLDYDRGAGIHFGALKGLEVIADAESIWFSSSQVTVLGGSAIAYLPRDWIWTVKGAEARTYFDGVGSSWSPAASTKLSIPIRERLRIEPGFGVGAENYTNIDQIGRISARTYMGAAKYRINRLQNFSVFVAYQQRSHGQSQTSVGGGYGFLF